MISSTVTQGPGSWFETCSGVSGTPGGALVVWPSILLSIDSDSGELRVLQVAGPTMIRVTDRDVGQCRRAAPAIPTRKFRRPAGAAGSLGLAAGV